MKTIYHIAVKTIDGTEIFSFMDEADLVNFIWDIEDNVLGMALAYDELNKP
jgi:uncharacterized protein (UPF0264 family)